MTDVAARILVVEDEAVVALDIEDRLRRLGYAVAGAVDSTEAALAAAAAERPDLVLMDIELRGAPDGIVAAERLRDELGIPVVFLTAFADARTLERAKRVSPHGYILKPFDEQALRTTIEIALHREQLERVRRQSHADLLAVLDAQRAGIVMIDGAGGVVFANTAARAMAGAIMAGAPWPAVLALDGPDRQRVDAQIDRPRAQRGKVEATLGTRTVEIEVENDPRDPSRRILLLHDVSEVRDLRRLLDGQGRFHDLVGGSEPMQRVMRMVADVARVEATVLILGETGTGKELVARAIHRESARADGPFVAVNCAGLGEELAASQLFGHRRGAFTGAMSDAIGVFEAAQGGTLFLDEVGDLPPRVQTTLLRALEERQVVRIGDTRPRDVDVRIVAATNRDLTADVAEGRFRADLLYRIRVGRITMPPLREHRDDLPALVRHALVEQRALTGRAVESVSDEAMRAMLAHPWPGNVRELKHAIAFAVIHARGTTIELDDLPPELLDGLPPVAPALMGDERERIVAALAHTGGERKAAAALLGIGRATLYRKLAQYGIDSVAPDSDDEPIR